MRIACDFDGVIVERYGIPRPPEVMNCPPMENSLEAIRFIRKQGHEVYIFSNRNKKVIQEWLKQNGFPKLRTTNIKEEDTAIYLDDRAVRFTNWMDFCKLLG